MGDPSALLFYPSIEDFRYFLGFNDLKGVLLGLKGSSTHDNLAPFLLLLLLYLSGASAAHVRIIPT